MELCNKTEKMFVLSAVKDEIIRLNEELNKSKSDVIKYSQIKSNLDTFKGIEKKLENPTNSIIFISNT